MPNGRNNPCHDDAECVIEAVRDCVAEYRRQGVNTVSALQLIANRWNVATRRIRTLFYRDQDISVGADERRSLSLAAAELLHRIADEQEARAARCRAKAEAIRTREKSWVGFGGDRQRRRAA